MLPPMNPISLQNALQQTIGRVQNYYLLYAFMLHKLHLIPHNGFFLYLFCKLGLDFGMMYVYNWQPPAPTRFKTLDREIARKLDYKM
jgi:hypothetical protein